jgi:hypothetical protein
VDRNVDSYTQDKITDFCLLIKKERGISSMRELASLFLVHAFRKFKFHSSNKKNHIPSRAGANTSLGLSTTHKLGLPPVMSGSMTNLMSIDERSINLPNHGVST